MTRLALVLALIGSPVFAQKMGIASHFGDVTVSRMEPGKAYNLKQLKGHGYALRNLSDSSVELVVDVVPALSGPLKPLYEEIPDPSWVQIKPSRARIGPQQTFEAEVIVRVPDDAQWADRHFQCALYARTVEGSFLNVGMYDKLYFSTGPTPEERLADAPRLDLLPASLRLGRISSGAYDSAAGKPRLRLRNATGAARRVRLEGVAFAEDRRPPKGFRAAVDPAEVEFPEVEVDVAAGQVRDVAFRLKGTEGTAGKRAYLVRAVTEGLDPSYGNILVESSGPAGGKGKVGTR